MQIFPSLPHRLNETPTSLVSRLALVHRAQSLRIFCLDMGFQLQSIVDGDQAALSRLAEIASVSVESLADAAIVRMDRARFSLRGQELVKLSLRRARTVVCPRCLLEDIDESRQPWMASGRAQWLLEPIRTCRRHGVALTELARSDAPGTLHDFARLVAPAIHDLANRESEATPSALEDYLLDRIDACVGPEWLDALPWHAAARTCEMIGAVAVFGRKAQLKTMTDEHWRAAGGVGFAVASQGVIGIRNFLDELRSTYPQSRNDPTGPQAWFGRLHTWLSASKVGALDPLRNIIVDMMRDTAPVGPDYQLYGRQLVDRRRLHSVLTLAQSTGLHPKRLQRVVVESGLAPAASERQTADRILFDAKRGEELATLLKNTIAHTQVEKYLNASRPQAMLLAQHQLIRRIENAEQLGLAYRSYDRRDLDRFLEALLVDAKPVQHPTPSQCDIRSAIKRANCSTIEIVQLLLDRKLGWVGQVVGKHGFGSVLVDVEEIKARTRVAPSGTLTAQAIEGLLGTSSRVVQALIEHKILPTQRVISVNRCPNDAIPCAAFEEFRAEYCSLHELCKTYGRHKLILKRQLTERGIRPVFDRREIPATFNLRSSIPIDL